MKSVLVRIQEYSAQASGAEKGVLRFLRENPEEAAGYSIKQLADKTFSSAATIVRLCRKMGFDGYKELQKSLLYESALRRESTRPMEQEIKKDDSLEELVNKVTYKNIVSLDNTRKLVDLDILNQCVELLDRSQTVYLFGIGSSLLVARDMYLKLLRVNKACVICDDWHAQLLQARNIRSCDLALIVSYSGLTEEMITCAREARLREAPVITISRFEQSPLVRLADYNLAVAATELIFRSGAMSSGISQLNMIDILYTAYVHKRYDECMEQFRKTHIAKSEGPEENQNAL